MAKFSPNIAALNAGEWTPLLDGRADIGGYMASASKMENFLPTLQGPAVRRAGTKFVNAVRDSADRTWLVPFVVGTGRAYVLEFGDSFIRVYDNRSLATTPLGASTGIQGITLADPAVATYNAAPGMSSGDYFRIDGVTGTTEVNGRWFKGANSSPGLPGTIELQSVIGVDVDSSSYTAWSAGGDFTIPEEIVSPYTASDLTTSDGEFNLDFVQYGYDLYLSHRGGAISPRKLTVDKNIVGLSDYSGLISISELAPDDGPFLPLNSDTSDTMYVSAATGTITITASGNLFSDDDIGSLIRIDQEVITSTRTWKAGEARTSGQYCRSEGKEYVAANSATTGTVPPAHTEGTETDGEGTSGGVNWTFTSPGYGVARITAHSTTTATATVIVPFPQTLVGSGNASSFWRRGAWSIRNGYPVCVNTYRERLAFGQNLQVYCSKVAEPESFAIDEAGEILTESAVVVGINSNRSSGLVALASGSALVAMTNAEEFTVSQSTTSQPFGPNNVLVAKRGSHGARGITPVGVGDVDVFVQSTGRKIRALMADERGYQAPDLTIRSEHITAPRITSMAWQGEPHQTLWCVRSDGQLLSFAFDQENEVRAWARHVIGGTNAKVESVAVIPSPDGTRDDLWMIVSRTINGGTWRFVEYMTPEYQAGDALEDAAYADSLLTYDGASTSTIYGVDHLEGETVGVMIDGKQVADIVVSGGEVALPFAGSVVQIGLKYDATYITNRIDGGAGDGTAQGKTKRITDAMFRVYNALGIEAGPSASNADSVQDLAYTLATSGGDAAPSLVSGDVLLPWPGGYETDGKIYLKASGMYPATVISIMPQIVVNEAR